MKQYLVALFALATVACSSVGSSAVATGPVHAPRTGEVGIYVAAQPPANAQQIGVIEAHAMGSEGNVETLLPEFAKRVAGLGGNAAVIDGVTARFDLVTTLQTETYSYPCGRYTCTGTRTYPVTREVMTTTMHGRAMNVPGITK